MTAGDKRRITIVACVFALSSAFAYSHTVPLAVVLGVPLCILGTCAMLDMFVWKD